VCKAADCLENVGALKSPRSVAGTVLPFLQTNFPFEYDSLD
jgi:hypothetical protein